MTGELKNRSSARFGSEGVCLHELLLKVWSLNQSIAWELVEMQNLGAPCRPATGNQHLHCNKIPGPFLCTWKLEKHWPKRISQTLILWFFSLQSCTHNTVYTELQSTNFILNSSPQASKKHIHPTIVHIPPSYNCIFNFLKISLTEICSHNPWT